MKIAVMQPYFFPYIGYYQLIHATDKFIIGDNFQFISQGWINRNRILNEGAKAFTYIRAPLQKHSHKAKIKDVKIVESSEWKESLLRQLNVYKRRAPYFKEVYSLVESCIASNELSIALFNANCLKKICSYLGLSFEPHMQSDLELEDEENTDRQGRIISLCRHFKAVEYINSIGGTALYNQKDFAERSITLMFLETGNITYHQRVSKPSIPNLSIIDLMMLNSREEIKLMLNNYRLI